MAEREAEGVGRAGERGFECERETGRGLGEREKDFFELISFLHPANNNKTKNRFFLGFFYIFAKKCKSSIVSPVYRKYSTCSASDLLSTILNSSTYEPPRFPNHKA
jgi:hypothetical protein